MDWFKIGKGVQDEYILSLYLFKRLCRVHHARCWAGWLSDMQMIPLMAESEKELNNLLKMVKEEREKAGIKLNIHETMIMASGPITSWQTDGEKVEMVADFTLFGSKITADGDFSPQIKRCLLLEEKLWQT